MADRARVVVTGMGAITPVGLTVRETWENALLGKSGIAPIQRFDASEYPVRIAGEVKGFDPHQYMSRKEARRMAQAGHDLCMREYTPERMVDRVSAVYECALNGRPISLAVQKEKAWN